MILFGYSSRTTSILKAVLSIVLGVVLIVTKANAMTLVVQIIAGAILVFGVFSGIVSYKMSASFPINSIMSALISILVFSFAGPISAVLRYILGGILFLFGLSQTMALFGARSGMRGGFVPFVIPVLVMLAGCLFFSEELIGNDIMGLIAGIAFIIYGLSDVFAVLKVSQLNSRKKSETITRVESPSRRTAGNWHNVDEMDVKDVDYEKID